VADFKDDLDILNYALTLELLEAELYRQVAASGKLTGDEQVFATDFGAEEAAHVTALRQTIQQLGGTPVAAPTKYNFPAFDTRDDIVSFLVTVEELGAGAYLSAAPEIKDPDVLTTAVQIHNVEGGHASIWQLQAGMTPVKGAFAAPAKRTDVLAAVAPLLGGGAIPAAVGTSTASTGSTAAGVAVTAPATATNAAPPSTPAMRTGGTTALPETGQPHNDSHGDVPAVLAAGIAVVGAGVVIRKRSSRKRKVPVPLGGDDT
jgi:rubrerythrin